MQTCARVLLGDRCTLLHTAAKQSTTATAANSITSSAAATVSSTQACHFVAEVDEPASGIALCRTYVVLQVHNNFDGCDSVSGSGCDASYCGDTAHEQQQQQQCDIALWYSVLQQAVEKGVESVNNSIHSSNNYAKGSQVSYSTTRITYVHTAESTAAHALDIALCT
jgi:hypothetical protein